MLRSFPRLFFSTYARRRRMLAGHRRNLCAHPAFQARLLKQADKIACDAVGAQAQSGSGRIRRSRRSRRSRHSRRRSPPPRPPTTTSRPASLTIYALVGCPFSDAAAALVENVSGATTHAVEPRSKEALRERLRTAFPKYKSSGHRTFPIVFSGTTFIGGYDDLKRFLGA